MLRGRSSGTKVESFPEVDILAYLSYTRVHPSSYVLLCQPSSSRLMIKDNSIIISLINKLKMKIMHVKIMVNIIIMIIAINTIMLHFENYVIMKCVSILCP